MGKIAGNRPWCYASGQGASAALFVPGADSGADGGSKNQLITQTLQKHRLYISIQTLIYIEMLHAYIAKRGKTETGELQVIARFAAGILSDLG